MKPINLYDIYRKVSQRRRTSKSTETQRKAAEMCRLADCIIDNSTLKSVKEFRKAEDLWLDSYDVLASMSMADQFEEAIRSKNYVSERSYYDPRGINGSRESGLVYCAMSASKPGQLKIGFTTMKLKVRFQKMSIRQGIIEPSPLFAISVSHPAKIEAQAKAKLREFLVTGCTKGGSVEWYQASAIELARAVVATVDECGNSVAEVMLFAHCPNVRNVQLALNRLGVSINRTSWY